MAGLHALMREALIESVPYPRYLIPLFCMNGQLEYDVSIVIPCYQEEGHILDSAKEIYKVMNGTNYRFEIIFVDDASTDETRTTILLLANKFPDVRYLFHKKNIGKGGAIANGVKIAKGKFIGHLDIDLEVSADYLPEVLSEIEKGNDIVLVKRKVRLSMNPKYILRDIAGIIHRLFVQKLLRIPHTDVQSGCKFFKRDILFSLLDETKAQGWFFDVEIITRAYYQNFQIKQIPGYYIRSKKKKSTVRLFSDGVKQLKKLVRFSYLLSSKRNNTKKHGDIHLVE